MSQNNNFQIYLIDSTTGSTGNYAQLDCEGIDLSNTFQVADVADISKRKDAITKTISFKNSKNNALVFNNLSNLNRVVDDTVNLSFLFNFNITKDIDAQVYENSTLIFVGKLHFISANRDSLGNITYDCSIKGYMVDFFNKIQDKLLSDLDFTPFNHTYNIATIKDSWFNIYPKNGVRTSGTTGSGFVYPLIDYGTNVTPDTKFDNQYDYRNLRPAFFIREYFNAIFNQTGVTGNYRYTVTGSTEFVDEFNKSILPNNDSDFSYAKSPGVFFEVAKTINPDQYNGKGQTFYDNTNKRNEYNHLIQFDTVVSGLTGQTIINPIIGDVNKITFINGMNTTITASVSVTSVQILGTNGSIRCMVLYRNRRDAQFESIGEISKEYKFTETEEIYQINPPYTFNMSFTHQFDAGGELAMVVYLDNLTSANNFTVNVVNADLKIGSPVVASQVLLNLGDTAELVGQNTQQIKQTDFLKSIIQMFNLYVYPDPEDSHNIIFTPYNDFYINFTAARIVDNSIDWTDRIDNASFTQTPVSDVFNLYKFVFKDDSDYYSKYYKDKYGDTYGNATLTGSTNGTNKSIELIFGSTPVASYNGRNVPWLWELDTDNTKKSKVTVPRILFYNGLVNCPSSYEVGRMALSASTSTYYFTSIDGAHVADYTFSQYPEANEYTLSSNDEFVDLTFGIPNEVFYTAGGTINSYGSGSKTLYDRYYAQQIKELQDSNSRIIETTAYLNENDIQQLDFRKPIYFNSVLGHNYFKLLSVEYSNSNEPSTIRLQTAYINYNAVLFVGYKSEIYANYIHKNDCLTSGYTGEAVYYLVPQGRYISYLSQVDADAKASNEAATSGQTFANTNGVCVYTGTTFSLGFEDNPRDATTTDSRIEFVTSDGTLNSGVTIFSYAGGNATRNISSYYGNDDFYYQTNTNSVIINSGTTASLSGATYDDYYTESSTKYLSCQLANNGQTTFINYKISDPNPKVGTVVKDSTGTSLVADGWYSDGTNGYHVISGTITTLQSCSNLPPPIS